MKIWRRINKTYTDQVKELTDKFQKEIRELSSQSKAGSGVDISHQMNNWAKEKELLQKEIDMMKVQLDERTGLYEEMMQSFKSMEQSKTEAHEANFMLTEAIKNNDSRLQDYEKKLSKYKKYKDIFEASAQIECIHCEKTISSNAFRNHMKKWPTQEDSIFSVAGLPPLDVNFVNSRIKTDENDAYRYREYEIKVDYRDQVYTIKKRINLFLTLYDNLEQHFPSLQMPTVPELFESYPEDRQLLKEEGVYSYDFTGSMTELLQYFCQNPLVRETVFFKKFLEIDKQFPDEFHSKKGSSNNPRLRATIGMAHSVSNFDLMPDGYSDSILSPKGNDKVAVSMVRHANTMHQNESPPERDDIDTDDDEWIIQEKEGLESYLP